MRMPKASYVAKMRSDSSIASTPSSTHGSMWEWWSAAPCRMPLAAIVVFLLKGHTVFEVKGENGKVILFWVLMLVFCCFDTGGYYCYYLLEFFVE